MSDTVSRVPFFVINSPFDVEKEVLINWDGISHAVVFFETSVFTTNSIDAPHGYLCT